MKDLLLSAISGISAEALANAISPIQTNMEFHRSLDKVVGSWRIYDSLGEANNFHLLSFYLNKQGDFLLGQTINNAHLKDVFNNVDMNNQYSLKNKLYNNWLILNFCTATPLDEEIKPNVWYIVLNESLSLGITNTLSPDERMHLVFSRSKIFPSDTSFTLIYKDNEGNDLINKEIHYFNYNGRFHQPQPPLPALSLSALPVKEASCKVLYAVVFYTDCRKENDWKIHALYESKEAALKFAEKWGKSDPEDRYVWPNKDQKILFDKSCFSDNEEETLEPSQEQQEPPYRGMSWTPCVSVVEVPIIKE